MHIGATNNKTNNNICLENHSNQGKIPRPEPKPNLTDPKGLKWRSSQVALASVSSKYGPEATNRVVVKEASKNIDYNDEPSITKVSLM